jgi:hypothetical protein
MRNLMFSKPNSLSNKEHPAPQRLRSTGVWLKISVSQQSGNPHWFFLERGIIARMAIRVQ